MQKKQHIAWLVTHEISGSGAASLRLLGFCLRGYGTAVSLLIPAGIAVYRNGIERMKSLPGNGLRVGGPILITAGIATIGLWLVKHLNFSCGDSFTEHRQLCVRIDLHSKVIDATRSTPF